MGYSGTATDLGATSIKFHQVMSLKLEWPMLNKHNFNDWIEHVKDDIESLDHKGAPDMVVAYEWIYLSPEDRDSAHWRKYIPLVKERSDVAAAAMTVAEISLRRHRIGITQGGCV